MLLFAFLPCLHRATARASAIVCALLVITAVCGWWPAAAHAQIQLKLGAGQTAGAASETASTPRVHAQLVAWAPQGFAANQPLQLGLRLVHQPGWHTYWKNPGDSGLPTQLDWQLPAGITTTDIVWPTPQQLRVGDMLNYGYEGTVLLPVPAHIAPAFAPDGRGNVELRLHASWLVCRVECIPEDVQLALTLPAELAHTQWATEFEAAHAQTPVALTRAAATASAATHSDRLQLRVQGLPPIAHGRTLALYAEEPDTLHHAAVLGKDWQQTWEGDIWQADVPLHTMRGVTPSQISFVLGLATQDSNPTHATPTSAWRITAHVQGQWQAAEVAQISPALAAALDTNAQMPATAPSSKVPGNLWVALVGGLLGGMLLNLMPCVFPVLAIKLMGLTRPGTSASLQRASGAAYAAGVVLSFTALGAVLLALRAAGEQLGWGFQLQSPWVVASLAALFTLIGLNLAGMFELRHVMPQSWANAHARHPVLDAFLSGLLAVAIASPCTAPLMGASLGFAIDMPGLQALAVFVALGLGMALPYLVLTWLPRLQNWLPRPGSWMEVLRRAMAFPMFATVVWLLWVLGQQSGIDGAAALLALLVCLAALVWAMGLQGRSRRWLSAVTLALGVWLLSVLGPQVITPTTPAMAQQTGGWQAWSAAAQAQSLAQGRPVFVDYTAAWCITCQYNKRTTLADPKVLHAFDQHQVHLLRADWTRRDPAITQALQALGRSGVPVYVLQAPGQAPVVLSEILTTAEVLTALAQLPTR